MFNRGWSKRWRSVPHQTKWHRDRGDQEPTRRFGAGSARPDLRLSRRPEPTSTTISRSGLACRPDRDMLSATNNTPHRCGRSTSLIDKPGLPDTRVQIHVICRLIWKMPSHSEPFPERKQLLVSSYVAGKHAISLWPTDSLELAGVPEADRPTLTPFLLKGGEPTSAILVCPGGGYQLKADHEGDPIARESSRPDALVVCYGVISLQVLVHLGSMENLLGPDASDDLVEELSADVQVTSDIRDAVGLQLAYGGRRAHQGSVAVCGGNLRHENLHDEPKHDSTTARLTSR
jgi:hypothetical protein